MKIAADDMRKIRGLHANFSEQIVNAKWQQQYHDWRREKRQIPSSETRGNSLKGVFL